MPSFKMLKVKDIIIMNFALIVSHLANIGTAAIYMIVIDNVFRFSIKTQFLSYTSLYIIAVFISLGALFFGIFFLEGLRLKFTLKIREHMIKRLFYISPENFFKKGTGYFSTRTINDPESASYLYSYTFYDFLSFFYLFIIEIPFLFFINKNISIWSIVGVGIFAIAIFYITRRGKNLSKSVMEANAVYTQSAAESIQGIKTIKLFGADKFIMRKNIGVFKDNIEKSFSLGVFNSWVYFLYEGLPRLLVSLLIFGLGGYYVIFGKLTVGGMIAFQQIFQRLISSISYFINTIVKFQVYRGAKERIQEILRIPVELTGEREVEIRGNIEYDDVWFRYNEEWVLKGVKFSIKEGEWVSLAGRSGAGKSTTINLLLGFYSPERGKILMDGIDINDIDRKNLRNQIGVIPQDIFIFSGSLRENILLGRDVDEDKLSEVIEYTGIGEMVKRLSNGLDTILGERGYKLSGGEKQRIGIARVILKNPKIVIFDEATSSLDSYSEGKIREVLRKWGKDKTFIIIAHRLSTTKGSKRIIFIEDGKVYGDGTHNTLMHLPDYKKMLKGQEEI